ncbi:hypothetical protein CMEL01_05939 [Colletotrichum melonis]|uniref:Uncharacterized protein n=1 Tax=Colletotrichum melonis TaxID=1209925 RepID=A0AAI9U7T8_9PEZI|nr:hypothetical protein CMEL01_05939 [Colletotrichum melonis]
MSLSKLPNLTDSVRVPYEIFLNIIEVLVQQEVKNTHPLEHVLEYDGRSEARIVVSTIGYDDDHYVRINRIRDLLHIDSRSRNMVSRYFPRMAMITCRHRRPRVPFVGRVCLATDIFTLKENHEIDFLKASIILPTVNGNKIVRNITAINGSDTKFFRENFENFVDVLASLPNLRKIVIDGGNYQPKENDDRCACSLSESHPEFTTVDAFHFPSLAKWAEDYGDVARKFGPQFRKRNTSIIARVSMNTFKSNLELDITEDAIRVKSNCRNCDCCECWVDEVCLDMAWLLRQCRLADLRESSESPP